MRKLIVAIGIGLATLLTTTLLTSSPASAAWCFSLGTTCPSEYSNHVICNEHWRASEAYKNQGCNLHKVNYDRTTNGVWYCFHDIYCDRGEWWQRASRKGLISLPDISKLRRCAENVRKIKKECTPITDAQIQEQIDAQAD